MEKGKKERIMSCTSFDELLNEEYGHEGTQERDLFESRAQAFCLAEQLKEERRKAGLTQEELANRIGTKKVIFHVSKTDIPTYNFQRCFVSLPD